MKIIFFYPDKLTQELFYKYQNIIFVTGIISFSTTKKQNEEKKLNLHL